MEIKIITKMIMAVLVLLIVVNIANAGIVPANNAKIPKVSVKDVKLPTIACDGVNYEHGGYTIPINTPVQVNDKTIYFKNVIKSSYPKNYDLAVTVVVSDIDSNGKITNSIEKILPRGYRDDINGLDVWNTGIYPGDKNKLDVASFLVRLYQPAVFPNCVNLGLYELGVGDSMMINNIIINMNSIGKPEKVTSFNVLDKDGTYSVIDAAVGDEFDVKGLHIKVNENNWGGVVGLPWAHSRLEISKSGNVQVVKLNRNSFYDSFLGRVRKV